MDLITQSLLSVVIPLYNEEENVTLLTEKIHESLRGYNYQIIYVDDFSTDRTRKIIKDLNDEHIHLISLKKNYGQSLALAAGIDYAQGDFIITMDGDLQNDPSDIPQMLAPVVSGDYDVVTGIRQKRKDSLIKKIPSKNCKLFGKAGYQARYKRQWLCIKSIYKRYRQGTKPIWRNAPFYNIACPSRRSSDKAGSGEASRKACGYFQIRSGKGIQGCGRYDAAVIYQEVFPKTHSSFWDYWCTIGCIGHFNQYIPVCH